MPDNGLDMFENEEIAAEMHPFLRSLLVCDETELRAL